MSSDKPADFVYEDEPDPTEDEGKPVAKVVDAAGAEPSKPESDEDEDGDETEEVAIHEDADESEDTGETKDGDDDFPW